jgi:hypothetical protein
MKGLKTLFSAGAAGGDPSRIQFPSNLLIMSCCETFLPDPTPRYSRKILFLNPPV